MKKLLPILAVVVLGLLAFGITVLVVAKVRGAAAPAAQAGEAAEPVAGAATAEQELSPDRPVTFLRFGSEGRLQTMVEELTATKQRYEENLRKLDRRARELDAWERQLKSEREDLRTLLASQTQQLTVLRDDVQQKQQELLALRTQIERAEEANLRRTAEIYSKMAPERAAEILSELYKGGQTETVVKIVYLMEGRSAAKALEGITDPKISADLTERLKTVTQAGQTGGTS